MPSEYAKLSDEQLAENVNCGKYDCFSELIGRIMPHIKSVALKYKSILPDTDDLIGEGVVAVFSAVKSYKSEKSSFKTFACLCVDRAISDKVRSANAGKRIPNSLISSMEEESISVESAEESFIRFEEDSNFTRDFGKTLSNLEKSVLERFLNGESYQTIAGALGVSVKSVDSALQRVRNKLRK